MARLTRNTQVNLSDSGGLRLRAAWLYYNRGWTQKDIADHLGISRSTIIRMLDEARKRAEVQIWINPSPADCTELAIGLEEKYQLEEAIVVPGCGTADETATDVGSALGVFLSEVIQDGMKVGVGWGRTLNASLRTFRTMPRPRTKIISLVGGLLETKTISPIDYSWQLASRLQAECMLFLAPLLVDSAETKQRLVERCGLDRVLREAAQLDIVVTSCGDLATREGSIGLGFLTPEIRDTIMKAGAVCDVCCNILDAEGRSVEIEIADRVMNTDIETIASAKHVVLASGGAKRANAIRAAILRLGCDTLVTDEDAARVLLDMPGSSEV